jgi:hypothetical protein
VVVASVAPPIPTLAAVLSAAAADARSLAPVMAAPVLVGAPIASATASSAAPLVSGPAPSQPVSSGGILQPQWTLEPILSAAPVAAAAHAWAEAPAPFIVISEDDVFHIDREFAELLESEEALVAFALLIPA